MAAESGATIWRGTAVDCPDIGHEIILWHRPSVFMEKRGCASRDITAYGVRIEENCYTSQLSITVLDLSMNNESVQCFYSNGTSTIVGHSYIEATKGKQCCIYMYR